MWYVVVCGMWYVVVLLMVCGAVCFYVVGCYTVSGVWWCNAIQCLVLIRQLQSMTKLAGTASPQQFFN